MRQIGRRQFLIAATASFAAQFARAQQPGRTYRVGALFRGSAEDRERYRSMLGDRLATHGFVEGRNLHIEVRLLESIGFGSGREAARALLEMKVDAIFSCFDGATEGALAATSSVPIIFAWVGDPVMAGIVRNLARPGGNVTGVTSRATELSLKRVELAIELMPRGKRIALIGVNFWAHYASHLRPLLAKMAARSGVQLLEINVTWGTFGPFQIDAVVKAGAQVAVTAFDLITFGVRSTLEGWIRRSLELRLPMIYMNREEVDAGGLMSYGTNVDEDLRRAADMLARVLKGERPGDLPIDQASRFELAVNLKTAKAIGITIPHSIMLRADRVIE